MVLKRQFSTIVKFVFAVGVMLSGLFIFQLRKFNTLLAKLGGGGKICLNGLVRGQTATGVEADHGGGQHLRQKCTVED